MRKSIKLTSKNINWQGDNTVAYVYKKGNNLIIQSTHYCFSDAIKRGDVYAVNK